MRIILPNPIIGYIRIEIIVKKVAKIIDLKLAVQAGCELHDTAHIFSLFVMFCSSVTS